MKGFRPGHSPEDKLKKEQEEAQKDFDKRLDEFQKELQPLLVKYKVGLAAVINYKATGAIPFPVWRDEKPLYEQKAKQEAEQKAKEGESDVLITA